MPETGSSIPVASNGWMVTMDNAESFLTSLEGTNLLTTRGWRGYLKKLRDIKVSPLSSSKVLILIAGKWTINYFRETAYKEIKTVTSLCDFAIKICTVQELTKIKYQVLYENGKT